MKNRSPNIQQNFNPFDNNSNSNKGGFAGKISIRKTGDFCSNKNQNPFGQVSNNNSEQNNVLGDEVQNRTRTQSVFDGSLKQNCQSNDYRIPPDVNAVFQAMIADPYGLGLNLNDKPQQSYSFQNQSNNHLPSQENVNWFNNNGESLIEYPQENPFPVMKSPL